MIACSAAGTAFASCGQICAASCLAAAAPAGPLSACLQMLSSFDFNDAGSGELANAVWQPASAADVEGVAGVVLGAAGVVAADVLAAALTFAALELLVVELELLPPQPAIKAPATTTAESDE
jgi:hypothetical protein